MLAFLLLLHFSIAFATPIPVINVTEGDFERIVTDFNEVWTGVPIDYRYNESTNATGGLSSAPGCPKGDLGYPWVYHKAEVETTIKCYLAGQQGPCDFGQKIFVDRNDPLTGYCNCECFEDVKIDGDSAQERFCSLRAKDVVFIPGTKKCYLLFEQGPCKENEWLVKRNESEVCSSSPSSLIKCEERRCPEGETPASTSSSDGLLQCNPPFFSSPNYIGQVLENDCPDSMRYSQLLKQCVKTFEFTR